MKRWVFIVSLVVSVSCWGQNGGYTEQSTARSEYFSWINNTNEGPDERQTLANLDFFGWLHDAYGMQLDIYAFDCGLYDGKNFTALPETSSFGNKFPDGLDKVYAKAKQYGISLGSWGGPDGFGNTPESTEARKKMMVSLCRDYDWSLFKIDAVCGGLRKEKESDFVDMMQQCRTYMPGLLVLNHRLELAQAQACCTTRLWEGRESYIDINSQPSVTTATHNRTGAMGRGLPPQLTRLVEDHGVCLSSCLDGWEDELILQAFNRALLLSPQIYGNPWLLSDNEYPKLARIFKMSKTYAALLVNGKRLPEQYGKNAVARGNDKSRLVTLRNLSWQPLEVTVKLDEEIGLQNCHWVNVSLLHPEECRVGRYKYGETVKITVPPFRSMLVFANANRQYKNVESPKYKGYVPCVEKVASMQACAVPEDAGALYEATVYSADNNALEVRSLMRSGDTGIPQVKAARDAFFGQETFIGRGLWDKYLFDGKPNTLFYPSRRKGDIRVKGGCFRLDLGRTEYVDSILIRVRNDYELQPLLAGEGNFANSSTDLKHWKPVLFFAGKDMKLLIQDKVRYLKINPQPDAISEIEVYSKGYKLDAENFRASNLFADSDRMIPVAAWSGTFVLKDIEAHSRLCIAINGEHGVEGAYAALKVDGQYMGAPSRSTSYPSNTWESGVIRSASNYTYYFPLTKEMEGKKIEAYVMAYNKDNVHLIPEIWKAKDF